MNKSTLAELIDEAESLGIFTSKRKGQFAILVADRIESRDKSFSRYQFLKECGVV